jgi:hypothetical protein
MGKLPDSPIPVYCHNQPVNCLPFVRFLAFFFFFGEFLVLLLVNFTNLSDSLPANSFFTLKSHFIFELQSYSFLLTKNLLSLIVFFSFAAIFYLLGLK